MNNLIIIGNGFDLAHGLKTSYNDFIEHLINKTIKENTFRSLIVEDYEIQTYEQLKKQVKHYKIRASDFKNKMLGILLEDISIKNWCDIEAKYYEILSRLGTDQASYTNHQALNKDFSFLRDSLAEYLNSDIGIFKQIESYSEFFRYIDKPSTLILNFNYTPTLKLLYHSVLKDSKIIYIHGEVQSEDNPIIFGFAATHEQSRNLIQKGENENMRFIKKNLYKTTENRPLLKKHLEDITEIDITILGHSCGISDNLILNQIFIDKNIRSIRLLYYEEKEKDPKGREHYFQTQINIDRIMNDDQKFDRLLLDYQSSTRMPQFNDNKEFKSEFINYVENFSTEQESRRPIPFVGFY